MNISVQQWQAAFDAVNDAVCLLDLQGKVFWSNAAMKRLVEKQPDDPVAGYCRQLLHEGAGRAEGCPFARMEESRRRETAVIAFGDRCFKVVVIPLLDEKADLGGAVHIMTDVTESRRSEEILDERMRLASLAADVGLALTRGGTLKRMLQQCSGLLVQHLDAAFARIWTIDGTGDFLILQASAGMYTHLDGPHGRIPISSPFKVPTIARDRRPLLTNTVVGDPHISEQEWAKREKMVAFAGYPLIVDGPLVGVMGMFARRTLNEFVLKALGAVADEIALAIEHKHYEEALKASEERFRSLIETAASVILCLSPDHVILELNPEAASLHGMTRDEALGKDYFELFLPESVKERVAAELEKVLAGEATRGFESMVRSRDGRMHILTWSANRLLDTQGRPTGIIAIGQDVTHEKQLETQLRQAQKLEAIGTLAGGIAHDFNNILGIIMGYTELAMFSIPKEDQTWSNLEDVLGASRRARDLIAQILAFSRKSEQERRPTQIGLIVKEALKMLRASLPATIEIKQAIGSKQIALADPTQVHQVLMNLCTNAAYAMREQGGILDVSLEDVDPDANFMAGHPDLQPGPYLRLSVKDTGTGMDPALRERIFDPYFTTKPKGEGTGLGLAVVHGIVKGYGGTITVDSMPDKGSIFHVYFPRLEKSVSSATAGTDAAALLTGKERILFVDDEDGLCKTMKGMLERLGYHVTAKTSPREALEAFREKPEDFDLVITDLTMPHMTGVQMAREMLSVRPSLPVILCSGFSEMMVSESVKSVGIRESLPKPLVMADLSRAIRRALDNGAGKK